MKLLVFAVFSLVSLSSIFKNLTSGERYEFQLWKMFSSNKGDIFTYFYLLESQNAQKNLEKDKKKAKSFH